MAAMGAHAALIAIHRAPNPCWGPPTFTNGCDDSAASYGASLARRERAHGGCAIVTISRVSGFGAVLADISERAAAHNISMHFRHTIRNPIGGCTDHPKCTKINSG